MDDATNTTTADEDLRREMSDRYRAVAAGMTSRVRAVPADRWDSPAPCEGWVARDVVDHLVGWLPAFYCGSFGVPLPDLPSADDDPVVAWSALDDFLQSSIDDPAVAASRGRSPLGDSFAGAFHAAVSDVLVHTWDLARAAGLDEHLDEAEVHRQVAALESMPFDAMVDSGHYAPGVAVPDGADEQTRLLAALGRTP
ncbi:TIGR03086 family metal-binding protein [Dermatobacter hominis]|uniref:TIGR03086 family metal-binding protein n=1 Tax=Dermatobacter hominis TaxID=2884263 RepID=UPI001D12B133|nr:TIGR03086 family metal-binding protein [Dermatobacter hominis]UDY37426.1 TIGR03086 family protein [Dermatobacter hominis]